jgi:RNA polymerase sigma-70 factor (sigma-E family)
MMPGARDEGFRAAFDRSFPLAERVAYRITGDAGMAQDLAAEALTRMFVRWPRFVRQDHVDAWVTRVATNLAIGVVRKRRPQPQLDDFPSSAEEQVVLRIALAEALARLPRRQREVVVLRYLSDLSEADVAAALGVSAGSVKTHLHRGLASLRSLLHVSDDSEVEVHLGHS